MSPETQFYSILRPDPQPEVTAARKEGDVFVDDKVVRKVNDSKLAFAHQGNGANTSNWVHGKKLQSKKELREATQAALRRNKHPENHNTSKLNKSLLRKNAAKKWKKQRQQDRAAKAFMQHEHSILNDEYNPASESAEEEDNSGALRQGFEAFKKFEKPVTVAPYAADRPLPQSTVDTAARAPVADFTGLTTDDAISAANDLFKAVMPGVNKKLGSLLDNLHDTRRATDSVNMHSKARGSYNPVPMNKKDFREAGRAMRKSMNKPNSADRAYARRMSKKLRQRGIKQARDIKGFMASQELPVNLMDVEGGLPADSTAVTDSTPSTSAPIEDWSSDFVLGNETEDEIENFSNLRTAEDHINEALRSDERLSTSSLTGKSQVLADEALFGDDFPADDLSKAHRGGRKQTARRNSLNFYNQLKGKKNVLLNASEVRKATGSRGSNMSRRNSKKSTLQRQREIRRKNSL